MTAVLGLGRESATRSCSGAEPDHSTQGDCGVRGIKIIANDGEIVQARGGEAQSAFIR